MEKTKKEEQNLTTLPFYIRVAKAQNEIKAPKSQYNLFSKYYYRSAEDILNAAKPICLKYGLLLNLLDDIEQIGDRFYVKATATILDQNSGMSISSVGYAREELSKKGYDCAQLTGASSTYARKYALNGLFCIDDSKEEIEARGEEHGKEGDVANAIIKKLSSLSTRGQIQALWQSLTPNQQADPAILEAVKTACNKERRND